MDKVRFKPTSYFLNVAIKVFEEQKDRIIRLLPYADIQHIGSTSIPDSITKGDLDIVIRVPKEKFEGAIGALKSLYEINQPENWSQTFASFKDQKNLGTDFGAQLVIKDSKSDDFVKLRDILIENPKLIEELNLIKVKHEGRYMEDYRKEKADFFQKLREEFPEVRLPFLAKNA